MRDEIRPEHSSGINQDTLKELVEFNPYKSGQELALDLDRSQSTICDPSKNIGKSEQIGNWGSKYFK